jgi:hypothetical protein
MAHHEGQMIIDLRIAPVSYESSTIQFTCECGNSAMSGPGQTKEFKHIVTTGRDPNFHLVCDCGKTYYVRVQGTHFHITEDQHAALFDGAEKLVPNRIVVKQPKYT